MNSYEQYIEQPTKLGYDFHINVSMNLFVTKPFLILITVHIIKGHPVHKKKNKITHFFMPKYVKIIINIVLERKKTTDQSPFKSLK